MLADLLTEHDTIGRPRGATSTGTSTRPSSPTPSSADSLETLPGVDRTAACAILSEIGADPHKVFGNAHRLAAWAGLCPGNNESAGKRRNGRARRGNQTLRAVLIESAHAAARAPTTASSRAYHQALTKRRGYKRAIVATAPQAVAMRLRGYSETAPPYRDPATDYEALLVHRNAPRWLRMLHQFDILVRNQDGTYAVHWPVVRSRSTAPTP